MKTKMFRLLFVLCFVGLVVIGCGGDGDNNTSVTPRPGDTIVGDWYVDATKLTFKVDNTYDVFTYVIDEYELMETGTYNYNEATKTISGTVTYELQAENGLGEGVNSIFSNTIDLVDNDSLLLTLMDEDEYYTLSLSTSMPTLPTNDLTIDFNDGALDTVLWDVDGSEEMAEVVNDRIHLSQLSTENADMLLNIIGYTEISADIEVGSISGGCRLTMKPWHPEILATCDYDNYSDAINTLIYDTNGNVVKREHIKTTEYGETHNFKVLWTGSSVIFYVDGEAVDTYTPPSNEIELTYTIESGVAVYGNKAHAYIDNFTATDVDTCAQAYAVFISSDCQREASAAFAAEAVCAAQCGGDVVCLDDCEETLWNSMPSCHAGWPHLFDHGGDPGEGICGQCYLDCDDQFDLCSESLATCLEELNACSAACQ